MKILLTLLIALVCINSATSQIFTDFENDSLDGWRSEGDGQYYLETGSGNPGNSMRVDDDASGGLNLAIAPVTFTGNWSAADSTDSVMVDLYTALINGTLIADQWAFRISGPGGSATSPPITPPLAQWYHSAVALDSSQWNVTSGTWLALMNYVSTVEIRAEYINGDEYVRLDNIGLTFTPLIVAIMPPVLSDFEKGTYDGWTFEFSGGTSVATSGGNPGRYVQITDGSGVTQALAPSKFLGDWTAIEQQAAIQFDLKITGFSGSLYLHEFWLKISGPGGTAVVAVDSSVAGAYNQWKTFAFLISEDRFTVTAGDWQALISDIRELRLVVEYINGTEIVWLDNFRITNDAPVAAFSAEPLFVFIGEEVRFTDQSLNAPHTWSWTFGDGNFSTAAAPFHLYQEAGTYDVSLTVNNHFGSDMLEKPQYIKVTGISDSILFSDDFDDNTIHPAWRFLNGTWVEQNQTMVQNSNYFNGSYIGGCYALVGSPLWKNYRLDVDLLSTDNDKIGVVFNYRDAGNFYLFTWQQEGPHLSIKRFIDGVQTDLDVADSAYTTNRWYHLSLVTRDGQIAVTLDSLQIFAVSDTALLSGKAGLYCHGNQNSVWNNFRITNLDFVSDVYAETMVTGPDGYALAQNYPNPFNPATTIQYRLAAAGYVRLMVYDLLGQQVKILVQERQPTGSYRVIWDGTNYAGEMVAGGLYLYRLQTGEYTSNRKMLFLK